MNQHLNPITNSHDLKALQPLLGTLKSDLSIRIDCEQWFIFFHYMPHLL